VSTGLASNRAGSSELRSLRACDLTAGEERAAELGRRVDDRTARVEDLSDARASLRKPRIALAS
jgi:hypothetical protein